MNSFWRARLEKGKRALMDFARQVNKTAALQSAMVDRQAPSSSAPRRTLEGARSDG